MTVAITVDGVTHQVPSDVTLAVALLQVGVAAFRRDRHGHAHAPLCAMGTCFECRVQVDGASGVRSCLAPVHDGMQVMTGDHGG